MAIVTWDHEFMSNYLNEPGMEKVLDMYYRPTGAYNDCLYVDDDETRRNLGGDDHTITGNGDSTAPQNGTSFYGPRLIVTDYPTPMHTRRLSYRGDDESSCIGGSVLSIMVVVVSLLVGITAT
jgi:hypothetical protein